MGEVKGTERQEPQKQSIQAESTRNGAVSGEPLNQATDREAAQTDEHHDVVTGLETDAPSIYEASLGGFQKSPVGFSVKRSPGRL